MNEAAGDLNRREDCLLLVIDMQGRLVPALDHSEARIVCASRLMRAARRLEVPVLATEHMPGRIGATDARLDGLLTPRDIIEKSAFSAMAEDALPEALRGACRKRIAVCGAEAHVCVMQTALEMMTAGYQVSIVKDATGARHESDRAAAFERLRDAGAALVTAEMLIFEWLGRGDDPAFRDTLNLIKEADV